MSGQDRGDYIANLIRQKNCTPVISNQMILDLLFGKNRLISLEVKDTDELDQGRMSADLHHQLGEAGLSLETNVRVQIESRGKKWNLIDRQGEYCMRRNNNTLDVETKSVAQAWADEIDYPLTDGNNLTRVVQFDAVENGDLAKWRYLEFLKRRLLFLERQGAGNHQTSQSEIEQQHADNNRESHNNIEQKHTGTNQTFLDNVERQLDRMNFTQLAVDQLHRPSFSEPQNGDSISILARLDLPVYITTSHHRILEAALEAIGKTPHTEVYRWREDLKIPPEATVDLRYEPTVDIPLVYHLFGVDTCVASLVLTEDDHLDFLVSIMRDFDDATVIPNHLRDAISKSMILLLGYDIHGWDLKIFLKGLIENTHKHPDSIAIQIDPADGRQILDVARFSAYVQQYFKRVRFDVIWSAPEDFIAALGEKMK